MSNGFVQRFKGRVQAAQLWLAGVPMNGPQSVLAFTTASATITPPSAIATLTATTGISVFTLGYAPLFGQELSLAVISVSSGVQIKAAAGTSFDPSTNTVIKSTQVQTITLLGVSTTKWSIKSVFPPSTLSTLINGITLSTTT